MMELHPVPLANAIFIALTSMIVVSSFLRKIKVSLQFYWIFSDFPFTFKLTSGADYEALCLSLPGSCKGKCDQVGTDPGAPCQCNKPCMDYGDCCPDYQDECGASGMFHTNFHRSLQFN